MSEWRFWKADNCCKCHAEPGVRDALAPPRSPREGLEFHPARLDIFSRVNMPRLALTRTKDMGFSSRTTLVSPIERDFSRIRRRRAIDQMGFGAKVFLGAVIAETNADWSRHWLWNLNRTVAKTLGPKITRLLAATRNHPILHHGLPGSLVVRGVLDLIFRLGWRRIARSRVRRRINRNDRFMTRRGEFQRDGRAVESACHDVRFRLLAIWACRNNGAIGRSKTYLRAIVS